MSDVHTSSSEEISKYIVRGLDELFQGESKNRSSISLHEPCFLGNEKKYVDDCISSGWVSSVGPYVDLFEKKLAEYVGAQYAIVTSNGTSALHVCFQLAGVSREEEVLVPALTFVATANAISYCSAIPHFIDSNYGDLGVDSNKLSDYLHDIAYVKNGTCINKKTKRVIRALCVVHVLGHPCNLDPIRDICKKYSIALVEDAAEALGSTYKDQHVGTVGKLSAFSFNGNKIITTGGGGAIVTNDESLAKAAKHLTTTAKKNHGWLYSHDRVAYNYRMPNINAALGCAQLEQIEGFLKNKRNLAGRYSQIFSSIPSIEFFREPSYAKSNYWLNAILIDNLSKETLHEVLTCVNEAGYGVRPLWELMHHLPMYLHCPRMDLTVAEKLSNKVINLPSSAYL